MRPRRFQSGQLADIEPGRIGQRAARIARGNEDGALVREKPCGVPADGAKTLNGHARALQVKADEFASDIDAGGKAETGRSDLVERNSADLAWQADGAAGLVLDPGHAAFVRAHVRTGNVIGHVAQARRRSCGSVPLWLPYPCRDRRRSTDLPPPCGNPAAAFFQVIARASRKHSSSETSGAIRAPPIAGPQAVLSTTTIAFSPKRGTVDVNDPAGAERVGKTERVFHVCPPRKGM